MPHEIDEAKRDVWQLQSVQVVNEKLAVLEGKVDKTNGKLDEFLIIAAGAAGSLKTVAEALKLGARSLAAIVFVIGLLAFAHTEMVEVIAHMLWKVVVH